MGKPFDLPVSGKNSMFVDDDEKRLTEHLFSNYNPTIRPVMKKGDNITVKFGLSLHQIIEVVMCLSASIASLPLWFLCSVYFGL